MTGKASRRGKALQKARYDALKAADICVTCGVKPANASTIRCDDCNLKKRKSDIRGNIRRITRKVRQDSILSPEK